MTIAVHVAAHTAVGEAMFTRHPRGSTCEITLFSEAISEDYRMLQKQMQRHCSEWHRKAARPEPERD